MDLETPHGTHSYLGIPDVEGQRRGADAGQASVQASVVLRNGLPHRLLRDPAAFVETGGSEDLYRVRVDFWPETWDG